ncbi:hypothetical protein PVAG01_07063 [Phlyctema vagabunda]|uniref:Cytochrome P450 n=1 Tax=Phlyctema vagabunda TaxID=108571 RepID=A0ABR4PBC5_9HELO
MEFSLLFQPFLVWAVVSSIFYTIYRALYRLYFSPISSFPGPKLAALTFWYEFYYDIILGGQYIWKIQALHEKHGPIVRINPYELHINDPEYNEAVFSADKDAHKWYWGVRGFTLPGNAFQTTDPALHRLRRSALNQYFSKQKTLSLQPIIKERVDKLVDRFLEFKDSGRILHLFYAYRALANGQFSHPRVFIEIKLEIDVVMEYSFSRHHHRVEAPDFDAAWHRANRDGGKVIPLLKHLNFVALVMDHIPDWITAKMHPSLAGIVAQRTETSKQIKAVRSGEDKSHSGTTHPTVFHDIFDSKLPESEKGIERVTNEAMVLESAGTGSTGWTLCLATFHLLANPDVLRKLKDELFNAAGAGTDDIPLATLQSLPYLSAVVNEAVRLSYGVTHRLQRVFLQPLDFKPSSFTGGKSWTIPANTPISMSIPLIHHNPLIFEEPAAFRPERWINEPSLSRYQFGFSKGSRRCLGMNLGMAELFTCLAAVFTKFGSPQVTGEKDVAIMELTGTDVSDVELWADVFVPVQKPSSQGVRVVVTSIA